MHDGEEGDIRCHARHTSGPRIPPCPRTIRLVHVLMLHRRPVRGRRPRLCVRCSSSSSTVRRRLWRAIVVRCSRVCCRRRLKNRRRTRGRGRRPRYLCRCDRRCRHVRRAWGACARGRALCWLHRRRGIDGCRCGVHRTSSRGDSAGCWSLRLRWRLGVRLWLGLWRRRRWMVFNGIGVVRSPALCPTSCALLQAQRCGFEQYLVPGRAVMTRS